MKKYKNFLSENFQFLVVKVSVYLNRHVFVMYIENFTTKKNENSGIFHISAQNIDCGYSLEPSR